MSCIANRRFFREKPLCRIITRDALRDSITFPGEFIGSSRRINYGFRSHEILSCIDVLYLSCTDDSQTQIGCVGKCHEQKALDQ